MWGALMREWDWDVVFGRARWSNDIKSRPVSSPDKSHLSKVGNQPRQFLDGAETSGPVDEEVAAQQEAARHSSGFGGQLLIGQIDRIFPQTRIEACGGIMPQTKYRPAPDSPVRQPPWVCLPQTGV